MFSTGFEFSVYLVKTILIPFVLLLLMSSQFLPILKQRAVHNALPSRKSPVLYKLTFVNTHVYFK